MTDAFHSKWPKRNSVHSFRSNIIHTMCLWRAHVWVYGHKTHFFGIVMVSRIRWFMVVLKLFLFCFASPSVCVALFIYCHANLRHLLTFIKNACWRCSTYRSTIYAKFENLFVCDLIFFSHNLWLWMTRAGFLQVTLMFIYNRIQFWTTRPFMCLVLEKKKIWQGYHQPVCFARVCLNEWISLIALRLL